MDEFIKSTKMEISGLMIADTLDKDAELEFTINDSFTWLTMSELKTLADHLNNILDGN